MAQPTKTVNIQDDLYRGAQQRGNQKQSENNGGSQKGGDPKQGDNDDIAHQKSDNQKQGGDQKQAGNNGGSQKHPENNKSEQKPVRAETGGDQNGAPTSTSGNLQCNNQPITTMDILDDLYIDLSKDNRQMLTCTVCNGIKHKPIGTPCGHSFCTDCLTESLKILPTCPECNRKVHRLQLNTTPVSKVMIDNLTVKCLYHDKGCEWKGKRKDYEMHVRKECKLRERNCRYSEVYGMDMCCEVGTEEKMAGHESKCFFGTNQGK